MQGTIAQIIALTTWGNAAISGSPPAGQQSFYPGNSTFIFCEYVRFVDLDRNGDSWHESGYASDPDKWLDRLKKEGVYSLRISHGPSRDQQAASANVTDRMLVGFAGGGGRWLIEAIKPTGSDYWEAQWEVGDQTRSDRKIWRVTYGRIGRNIGSSQNEEPSVEGIRARLSRNLAEIAKFARSHQEDGFAKAFESGLSRLSSSDPYAGLYHADIAPPKLLPPYADQYLAAAQAAWVFGGMGSWNDLGFEGDEQTKYEQLSEELYLLLNQAIVAAANSNSHRSQLPQERGETKKPWWKKYGGG